MSSKDKKRREQLEGAVEDSREWVERAAEDVAETIGRTWRELFHGDESDSTRSHDESDGPRSTRPTVEDLNRVDPVELFSRERQREAEKMGHANIVITGQTGVGKSTLINAIFRKPLAKADIGRPVTKLVQKYEDPEMPVTLYDTPGIELGDSVKKVIRDFKNVIADQSKKPPKEHIHVLWYCLNPEKPRIESYDVAIVQAMAEELPVILVLTQCIDSVRADDFEAELRKENLPVVGDRVVRTLATPRIIAGQTIQPTGLEELVRLTHEVLPEAVRRAFTNAQGVVIDLKIDQSRMAVVGASAAAATIGAVPIPIPDAVVLMPVQVAMLGSITAIFGVHVSEDSAAHLVRGVVGQGGVAFVGKQMAKTLLKFVPGGNVINAAVAAALTAALGEAYIQLCAEMLRRQAAGKPMPDAEMLQFLLDAYQAAFRGQESTAKPKPKPRAAGSGGPKSPRPKPAAKESAMKKASPRVTNTGGGPKKHRPRAST